MLPATYPQTGLRVAIVVSGSRGDVQPLVALALVLRRLGHQVSSVCKNTCKFAKRQVAARVSSAHEID